MTNSNSHLNDVTKEYYENYFEKIHYTGAMGWYSALVHRQVEKRYSKDMHFGKVLEIGGLGGQHLDFVRHDYSQYISLDLQAPVDQATSIEKVEFVVGDVEAIPFPDETFDRTLNVCVLHHVMHAERALAEMKRVTRVGGTLTLFVSCDPGLLMRYVRHFFSHIKTSKTMGIPMLETKYLWATEHRGHALAIWSIVRKIFQNDIIKLRRFPFPFLSWNFNLFLVIDITKK